MLTYDGFKWGVFGEYMIIFCLQFRFRASEIEIGLKRALASIRMKCDEIEAITPLRRQ
jgi:hypothetical protein